MTNSDLWKQISDKNPSFNSDGNITLSAKGLRKLFDLAYNKGFEQGKEVSKTINDIFNNYDKNKESGADIFKGIFGETFSNPKK